MTLTQAIKESKQKQNSAIRSLQKFGDTDQIKKSRWSYRLKPHRAVFIHYYTHTHTHARTTKLRHVFRTKHYQTPLSALSGPRHLY